MRLNLRPWEAAEEKDYLLRCANAIALLQSGKVHLLEYSPRKGYFTTDKGGTTFDTAIEAIEWEASR